MILQSPPKSDLYHARAVHDAETDLSRAIQQAAAAGLTVEVDVQYLQALGEPPQPAIAINLSRPIILPRYSDGALVEAGQRKAP